MWNPGFIRQFQDWELDGFEELLRRLQVFRKCTKDKDDLTWKASKSEKFLVRSFFSTLESDRGVYFHLNVVWNSREPLNVAFFA